MNALINQKDSFAMLRRFYVPLFRQPQAKSIINQMQTHQMPKNKNRHI